MTDGWWRIKQHAPNAPGGFLVTEIPVRPNPDAQYDATIASHTIPWWIHETIGSEPVLGLVWEDGREEYYPWASIVHAEYQPPTSEEP